MLLSLLPCLPTSLQAMAAHLQRIRLLTRRKSTLGADSMPAAAVAGEREAKKTSSPLFPLQVNMVAERPALRFEHHPLEVGPCSPPATHSHSPIRSSSN
jgi:type II secretory pathway component PulJ